MTEKAVLSPAVSLTQQVLERHVRQADDAVVLPAPPVLAVRAVATVQRQAQDVDAHVRSRAVASAALRVSQVHVEERGRRRLLHPGLPAEGAAHSVPKLVRRQNTDAASAVTESCFPMRQARTKQTSRRDRLARCLTWCLATHCAVTSTPRQVTLSCCRFDRVSEGSHGLDATSAIPSSVGVNGAYAVLLSQLTELVKALTRGLSKLTSPVFMFGNVFPLQKVTVIGMSHDHTLARMNEIFLRLYCLLAHIHE